MNLAELMKLFDKYKIEYRITDNTKEVEGVSCAKYFTPQDKIAEVVIKIGRR